jgi:leucyl aminopeptidase
VLTAEEHRFWVASAKATAYARDLVNTRGSIATPDYMEDQVRKLVAGKPNVKDFRVIKG